VSRPLADRVVVVGGINADLKARTTAPLVPGTSNPGTATLTPGGVGRNVAENLAHLGRPVALAITFVRLPSQG
jgi:pseudouridine kinase